MLKLVRRAKGHFVTLIEFHVHLIRVKPEHISRLNQYVVNWVIDILKDRQQRNWVDNVFAPFPPVYCGVPQDTVLEQALFTIMVNNISLISK